MPRIVFKLMWENLEAKKPFAGYVKNLAKNGEYYWVVVLVVPISNGYLSVRFKPSTEMFSIVKDFRYTKLLAEERWKRSTRCAL